MRIFPQSMPMAWRIIVSLLLCASAVLMVLSFTTEFQPWWAQVPLLVGILVNGAYSLLDRHERETARALASLDDDG